MEITYKLYNLSTIFKTITTSNLIKILQSFEICLGITDNLSLGSSTSFILQYREHSPSNQVNRHYAKQNLIDLLLVVLW